MSKDDQPDVLVSLNDVVDLLTGSSPGRLSKLLGEGIGPRECGCYGGYCGCDRAVNITLRAKTYAEFASKREEEIACLKERLSELERSQPKQD